MQEIWFRKHRGKDERAKRKQQVESFSVAFQELGEVLETLRESPSSDYDMANWPLHMADINGANRKLDQVLSLIRSNKRE